MKITLTGNPWNILKINRCRPKLATPPVDKGNVLGGIRRLLLKTGIRFYRRKVIVKLFLQVYGYMNSNNGYTKMLLSE
jgi:hypothetical protein